MATLIEAAITAAVLAERYRIDIREYPDREPGWTLKADLWSAVSARLVVEIGEAAGCQTQGSNRLPYPVAVARRDRVEGVGAGRHDGLV